MLLSRRTMCALPLLMAAPGLGAKAAMVARTAADDQRLAALRAWLAQSTQSRDQGSAVLAAPLDRQTVDLALQLLSRDRSEQVVRLRSGDIAERRIAIGDKTLRWEERVFGPAPANGRSLWISLHGGGNAPPEVNDQQWRNQIRLYEPSEGIYIAPRAPTDTWNLWHEAHMDGLLQALIDAQVAANGVNPDKVYILGYSAGGDGVWQLAPRLADRFAAAATMAGHPNDAALPSLRNLPIAVFMGGDDAAYDRNVIAAQKTRELDALQRADPGGYTHISRIYPGLPHWMNRRDAEALPWMAHFSRRTWPDRIVWIQDDVPVRRFYWLEIPTETAVHRGDRIDATVRGQRVTLEGKIPAGLTLRLSDKLLNLDKPVTVIANGKVRYRGRVPRTAMAMYRSLQERVDVRSAATAMLTLT